MAKHRSLTLLRWTFFWFLVGVGPQALAQSGLLGGLEEPYPLRAADTSSPRDTLRSFTRDFTEAVEAWRNDEPRADILRPLLRASDTIDFSELPILGREGAIVINMALLREVLDRVELPQYEKIPGDEDVTGEGGLIRWVVPNTKIEIVKIEAGPQAGQFLFSKETMRKIRSYYDLAKSLPYKAGAIVGIYDEFLSSPGQWLPHSLPDNLPGWATRIVAGQGVWQWIALTFVIIASAFLIRMLYRLGASWDEKQKHRRPHLRFGVPAALLAAVAIATIVEFVAELGIGLLEFSLELVSHAMLAVQLAGLSWFVVLFSGRLADAIGHAQDRMEGKQRINTALMRILFRLISIVCLIVLGITAAEAIGIPIAPLVAGLGVSGLAIALAIRPTLENVIGGLTLFADRPVRVGDFCRYGNNIGTVEQIGLRSTRIRSLERTIITIPNSEFSQMQLDNFEIRDMRLLKTVLQLRYETTPEQMRYVLAKLRELLLGHPMITPDPARVRFIGFGAFSKNVEIFAYLRCRDHNTFLAIQEDVLLRIENVVHEAGTGFAFPSQTAYLARDIGLDPEHRAEAEAQVKFWRAQGKLPFPEFEEEERQRLEDILDYPPKGSPDHSPRVDLSAPISAKNSSS